ncbi:hypothetical protein CB1_002524011 [Camelus ferus]|nr:hypothetical protein CB1_002524011 [Camelus ferus]
MFHSPFTSGIWKTLQVKNCGIWLVGTSLDADVRTTVDSRLLVQNRRLLAGTGCLVLALETAAQRQADLLGKPNHFLLDCVSREDGISLERTVIGLHSSG